MINFRSSNMVMVWLYFLKPLIKHACNHISYIVFNLSGEMHVTHGDGEKERIKKRSYANPMGSDDFT